MARLDSLKALVEQQPGDARIRFMLSMEYISCGDHAGALREFDALIAMNADYVAAYFQAGRTSETLGNADAARAYYQRGLEAAERTGDRHAAGEISDALAMLG
jgi:tetratricopeptide (TPR) repeat protein